MNWKDINTDRIIGLSAMLISLLTLIIFIYQTNLMRTQSRLSVTPRIGFSQAESSEDSVIIISETIVNKGLGPAIIESIEILHKGQRYPLDFVNFLDSAFPEIHKYIDLESSTQMNTGSTLSAGESKQLYRISIPVEKIDALLAYVQIEEDRLPFAIEVVYSSIYNERWKDNSLRNGHPVPL
ncbi:MAG: hypothetical protein AAGG75_26050 [Bacteroidota bacterium]